MRPADVGALSWSWIALEVCVPSVIGILAAFPMWKSRQPILGNLTGTTIIFASAIALIMREHVELTRITERCLDLGYTCWPDPSAFTRYAIYAFIALLEVMVLFSVSLKVETRHRRRGYDPEWR